ncbi:hypothetical protein WMF30_30050 [Sorangium sp. So ce134]
MLPSRCDAPSSRVVAPGRLAKLSRALRESRSTELRPLALERVA